MLLVRYGGAFFITYMLVAVGLLVAIETPFNDGFVESIMWSFLPILMLCAAFTRQYMNPLQILSRRSVANIWFWTFLMAGGLALISWPYALLVNATFGESQEVEIGGFVEDKLTSGKRSPSVLVIRSERLKQTVKLQVPKARYDAIRVGERHTECFFVGSLGFYYRWRDNDKSTHCHTIPNAP
jgi:hypothetical protein